MDADLLPNLKTWRREQAREQGCLPPYVVFQDRPLLELEARQPTNLADLGACRTFPQAQPPFPPVSWG